MTHDKISCSVRMSRSMRMRICDSKLARRAGFCFILMCAFVAPASAFAAEAKHGMVVTVHPLATDAAVKVLHDGGNAIDAAGAAGGAPGVVGRPKNRNCGGGVIYIGTGRGQIFSPPRRRRAAPPP